MRLLDSSGWFSSRLMIINMKAVSQSTIKNYQQKMKVCQDVESEISLLMLPMDFKKKPKSKPNTDRTSTSTCAFKKQSPDYTSINPSALIQKKKLYSMAIRQKNLAKKIKCEYYPQEDLKVNNATETLKSNSSLLNETIQLDSKTQDKQAHSRSKIGKENDLHSKVQNAKREITKIKKMSAAIQDLRPYPKERKLSQRPSDFDLQQFCVPEILPLPHPSAKFCLSIQVNQSLGPFISPQDKEIEILRRQNNTFKRELANFRRQNGSLKRELQQAKKTIEQLKQSNDTLASQNEDNIRLLESFQLKVSIDFDSSSAKDEFDLDDIDKLRETLTRYQQKYWETENLNRRLELRNYMLEKRLADESESHRKAMAREISAWKERYIKARNENIRLKDVRESSLFEMSLSIDD